MMMVVEKCFAEITGMPPSFQHVSYSPLRMPYLSANTTAMPYMVPDLTRHYTTEEVLAFPNSGNQYQLCDGKLFVSPAPTRRHQRIVNRLTTVLLDYLKPLSLEDTFVGCHADISWTPGQLFQPDLFIMDVAEVDNEWKEIKTLRLAAEVLSPSTAIFDRNVKRPVYQTHNVGTLWLIDPNINVVEVWTPTDTVPTIATQTLTWRYASEMPDITIDLEWLLR